MPEYHTVFISPKADFSQSLKATVFPNTLLANQQVHKGQAQLTSTVMYHSLLNSH